MLRRHIHYTEEVGFFCWVIFTAKDGNMDDDMQAAAQTKKSRILLGMGISISFFHYMPHATIELTALTKKQIYAAKIVFLPITAHTN